MTEHTSTPWRFEPDHPMYRGARQYIWGPEGPGHGAVATLEGPNQFPETTALHKANAEYIVQAVNAHDELLAACKAALAKAESWIHDQLDGTSLLDDALAELQPVRDAIAKAKPHA